MPARPTWRFRRELQDLNPNQATFQSEIRNQWHQEKYLALPQTWLDQELREMDLSLQLTTFLHPILPRIVPRTDEDLILRHALDSSAPDFCLAVLRAHPVPPWRNPGTNIRVEATMEKLLHHTLSVTSDFVPYTGSRTAATLTLSGMFTGIPGCWMTRYPTASVKSTREPTFAVLLNSAASTGQWAEQDPCLPNIQRDSHLRISPSHPALLIAMPGPQPWPGEISGSTRSLNDVLSDMSIIAQPSLEMMLSAWLSKSSIVEDVPAFLAVYGLVYDSEELYIVAHIPVFATSLKNTPIDSGFKPPVTFVSHIMDVFRFPASPAGGTNTVEWAQERLRLTIALLTIQKQVFRLTSLFEHIRLPPEMLEKEDILLDNLLGPKTFRNAGSTPSSSSGSDGFGDPVALAAWERFVYADGIHSEDGDGGYLPEVDLELLKSSIDVWREDVNAYAVPSTSSTSDDGTDSFCFPNLTLFVELEKSIKTPDQSMRSILDNTVSAFFPARDGPFWEFRSRVIGTGYSCKALLYDLQTQMDHSGKVLLLPSSWFPSPSGQRDVGSRVDSSVSTNNGIPLNDSRYVYLHHVLNDALEANSVGKLEPPPDGTSAADMDHRARPVFDFALSSYPWGHPHSLQQSFANMFLHGTTSSFERSTPDAMKLILTGFLHVPGCTIVDDWNFSETLPLDLAKEPWSTLVTRLDSDNLPPLLQPGITFAISWFTRSNADAQNALARLFDWPLTLLILLLSAQDVHGHVSRLPSWCFLVGIVHDPFGAHIYSHHPEWNPVKARWRFVQTEIGRGGSSAFVSDGMLSIRIQLTINLLLVQRHSVQVEQKLRELLDASTSIPILARLHGSGM